MTSLRGGAEKRLIGKGENRQGFAKPTGADPMHGRVAIDQFKKAFVGRTSWA